ncbi:hypothetical protein HC766_06335 [Candidatus Gracilibacteria bacterium]|nr:hypothetical protein [Candidatus Gracilibacteria bacterium]
MVHDFIEIKLNSYSKKQLSLEDPKELVISIEQEKLDDNYRDWSYENRIIEAKENQKIKHLVNALELEN